jgi:hypothetical protein
MTQTVLRKHQEYTRKVELREASTIEEKAAISLRHRFEDVTQAAEDFGRKWNLGPPDDAVRIRPAWNRDPLLLVYREERGRQGFDVSERCAGCGYVKTLLEDAGLSGYGYVLGNIDEFEWECPRCNPRKASKEALSKIAER